MTSTLVLFTDEDEDFEIICLVVEPPARPQPKVVVHADAPSIKAKRVAVDVVINEETIIEDHLHLVTSVMERMKLTLPPHVNADDLYSAGISGLMNACMKFDREQARKFQWYARLRIRGAMLDWLRKLDFVPRRARAAKKKMDAAILRVEARTLKDATDEEIAAEMSVSIKQLDRIKSEAGIISFVALDSHAQGEESEGAQLHEFLADSNDVLASKQMEEDETINLLLERVDTLSPMHKRVIQAYYFEGKRLQDIAEEFDLTESRICQIHRDILQQLKKGVAIRRDR